MKRGEYSRYWECLIVLQRKGTCEVPEGETGQHWYLGRPVRCWHLWTAFWQCHIKLPLLFTYTMNSIIVYHVGASSQLVFRVMLVISSFELCCLVLWRIGHCTVIGLQRAVVQKRREEKSCVEPSSPGARPQEGDRHNIGYRRHPTRGCGPIGSLCTIADLPNYVYLLQNYCPDFFCDKPHSPQS